MLVLFELKLLKFFPLNDSAWFVIICGAISYILGTITILYATNHKNVFSEISIDPQNVRIVLDRGSTLKLFIYVTGIIGLFSAIQNWYILINKFGNIPAVFISANTIYRARIDSQIEGVLPYFHAFSSVGITLAGFYTAYKNRLTLVASIPVLAAVLKSLAMFGRIGMLMALVQFISSYFLSRQIFKKKDSKTNYRAALSISFVFIIIITAASLVKSFRGTYERYRGASEELAYFTDSPIFSPSVYLYLSSHVGVLNRYLEENKENVKIGENTFAAVYNLLEKFGIGDRIPYDVPGYYLPMWTNTGTYLRDLHADFGVFGVILVPYLIGFFTTFMWYKFFSTGRLFYFTILIQFYIVIGISFFSLVTRGAEWIFTLVFLMILSPYLENRAKSLAREKND